MMSADAEQQDTKSLEPNPTDEKKQTKTQEVHQIRLDQLTRDMSAPNGTNINIPPVADPTAHDHSSAVPDPASEPPAAAPASSAPSPTPAPTSASVSAPTAAPSLVDTSLPIKTPGTGPIEQPPDVPKIIPGTGPIEQPPDMAVQADSANKPVVDTPDFKEGKTSLLNEPDFEEGTPKWGTAQFTKRKHLILTIDDSQEIFVFNAEEITEISIGRFDPTTNTSPDVDLLKFGGGEKGVSRKHAVIIRRDGALSVVDHNSGNGTYLNGQKLVANQPRILRNGDDLRLGNLKLRVSFVQR